MLKKLKMPKPKSMETDELDMTESPEEEAAESPEEEGAEIEAEESAEHPELAKASDEDLLAEVKKRGLMAQLEKETSHESSEDAYV